MYISCIKIGREEYWWGKIKLYRNEYILWSWILGLWIDVSKVVWFVFVVVIN